MLLALCSVSQQMFASLVVGKSLRRVGGGGPWWIRWLCGEGTEREPVASVLIERDMEKAGLPEPTWPSGFPPRGQQLSSPLRSQLTLLPAESFFLSLFRFLSHPENLSFHSSLPFLSLPASSVSVSFSRIRLLSSAFYRIHSIWLAFSSRELICNLLFFQAVFCFQETKCLLCVMFSCVWLMITGQLWAVHLSS